MNLRKRVQRLEGQASREVLFLRMYNQSIHRVSGSGEGEEYNPDSAKHILIDVQYDEVGETD